MDLIEENFFGRLGAGTPAIDAALKIPQLALLELTVVLTPEPLKKRFKLELGGLLQVP